MANGIQTANGKAFEYACVLGVYNELATIQKIEIEVSPQFYDSGCCGFHDLELAVKKSR